ncbi:MAG: ABC transporter permease [Pirellulales bacterium]
MVWVETKLCGLLSRAMLADSSGDASSLWASVPLAAKVLAAVGLLIVVAAVVLGKIPFRYNVRNLFVRWKTTLSTGVVFVLVIALLTATQAFVNGMYRLTEASAREGNVMILSEGSTDEVFSNFGFSDINDIANQPGVLRDALNAPLCSKETYLIVVQPRRNPKPDGPQRRFIQLRGVEDPAISGVVHGMDLHDGGAWFSSVGVERRDVDGSGKKDDVIQAVIGEGLASELGRDRTEAERKAAKNQDRLAVGDVFELRDRRWLVVGVMKSAGTTFDSEVWAKQSLVGPMFGKVGFSTLVLRTQNDAAAEKLKEFFNTDYKKAAVTAYVEREYFDKLNQTNQQFSYAIGFIAFWIAIAGIAGTMNTMFAAISQRTKDIGVLRIVGFARWQILLSFLIESLFIALVGGAIGVAIGSLVDGSTMTSVVSSGQGGGKSVVIVLSVNAAIVAQGLLLALFMGGFGGLIPAINAMRVRPLESLR